MLERKEKMKAKLNNEKNKGNYYYGEKTWKKIETYKMEIGKEMKREESGKNNERSNMNDYDRL